MIKLPRNNEAEQAILGSCLIAPDVVPLILESLTVGDFYASNHKQVFKAIQTLYLEKSDTDIDEVLLNSQKAILGLSLTKETPLKTTKELAIDLYRKIESGNHSVFQGAKTGFDRLDWILGGMKPGKLYILAGRPRMGETAVAKKIG